MKISILAFGIAKEILGSSSISIEVAEELPVTALKKMLEAQYPALKDIGSYRIAVNNEFAEEQTTITMADEVAIIPPVSGG